MSIPQFGQTIRRTYEARVVSVRSNSYGYRIECVAPGSDISTFTNVDFTGAPTFGGTIEIIAPTEPPVGTILVGTGYPAGGVVTCRRADLGHPRSWGFANGSDNLTWERARELIGHVICEITPDGQVIRR